MQASSKYFVQMPIKTNLNHPLHEDDGCFNIDGSGEADENEVMQAPVISIGRPKRCVLE